MFTCQRMCGLQTFTKSLHISLYILILLSGSTVAAQNGLVWSWWVIWLSCTRPRWSWVRGSGSFTAVWWVTHWPAFHLTNHRQKEKKQRYNECETFLPLIKVSAQIVSGLLGVPNPILHTFYHQIIKWKLHYEFSTAFKCDWLIRSQNDLCLPVLSTVLLLWDHLKYIFSPRDFKTSYKLNHNFTNVNFYF